MMILTQKMIGQLRFQGQMAIDEDLETSLLSQFGVEPYPHEYSEQDLHEQVRKVVMQYKGRQEDSLSIG